MASKQIREIIIKVTGTAGTGLNKIIKGMKDVEKNTKSTALSLRGLNSALLSISTISFAGIGISTLTDFSDSMQLARERVKGIIGPMADIDNLMGQVADIAKRSRAPIDGVADAFARVAVAGKSLNLETDAMLGVVQALSQAALASGARTSESAGALVQFTQAMSRGVLRGQEWRSVQENIPLLAAAIREEVEKLGVSVTEFAEGGGLTMNFVLKALGKNIQGLDDMAKNMSYTFGQTSTQIRNDMVQLADKINQATGASEKFNSLMSLLSRNSDKTVIAISAIAVAISVQLIPALIRMISSINAATLALSFNPALAAIGVVAGAATAAALYFSDSVKKPKKGLEDLVKELQATDKEVKNLTKGVDYYNKTEGGGIIEKALGLDVDEKNKLAEMVKKSAELRNEIEKIKKAEKSRQEALNKGAKTPFPSITDQIRKLNEEFKKGNIDLKSYNEKLLSINITKLDNDFKAGKLSLGDYNKKLEALKIDDLSRKFEMGAITLEEYNNSLEVKRLRDLNRELKQGKINLDKYYRGLLKLQSVDPGVKFLTIKSGIEGYLASIGSFSEGVSKVITTSFNHLEDSLVTILQTGKLEMKDFVAAVTADLQRLVVRMAIVRPLAQGLEQGIGAIGSYFSGSGTQASTTGIFTGGGLTATAGITKAMSPISPVSPVSSLASKTITNNIGGQSQVYVNVNNNGSGEATVTESQGPDGSRVIDVLISGKIKESISNGSLDRLFNQSYGLSRKGV